MPTTADAIPAYARLYNVSCNTCHASLPPRLNNVGILFRKYGFRMPDADDEGRLILKTVTPVSLGQTASVAADVAGRRDDEVEEGENRSSFELSEVEIVSGITVGKRISAQAMFVPWEDGEVELEDAEIQYNAGSARHQLTARGGLMQTYLWQKANHGSLTLSTPLLFDSRAVEGVGGFEGFGIGVNQIGAEAGYIFTRLEEGRLSSFLVTTAVLNGVDEEGEGAVRNTTGGADVYVQGLHLFGARNTVGAFYYRGRTLLSGSDEGEPSDPLKHRFARYGLMGNYFLFDRVDVLGGFGQGWDRPDIVGVEDVRTRAFYAEFEVPITKRWIGVYRYDRLDPNLDEEEDFVRSHTISTTLQAEDHLYLIGEYRRFGGSEETSGTFVVNARFIF